MSEVHHSALRILARAADDDKISERIQPAILTWRLTLSESLGDETHDTTRLERGAAGALLHRPPGLGRLRLAGAVGSLCRASRVAPTAQPARGMGQRPCPRAQQRRGVPFALLAPRAQRRAVVARALSSSPSRARTSTAGAWSWARLHAPPSARGFERSYVEGRRRYRRRWGRDPLADDAPLEQNARYAFAVLLDLAQRAVEHRLPMKLDY